MHCLRTGLLPRLALLQASLLVSIPLLLQEPANATPYDAEAALRISQDAVGSEVRDHEFRDHLGRTVRLSDFSGKPLVISMIFTSCHHVCPTLTQHLKSADKAAREVLGSDSYNVLTIGFDAARDTPAAMQAFAREQRVNSSSWRFVSGSPDTIDALSSDLGYTFYASPRGFDHINQLTVIDGNGVVYRQVYGMNFELPWLVEPLKELVFNRPDSAGHVFASLYDRVRLFCTVYDPASGRYEIDNSLFIQIAIGFIVILSGIAYLWRGFGHRRRS